MPTTLQQNKHYFLHFMVDETGPERSCVLPEATQLNFSGSGISLPVQSFSCDVVERALVLNQKALFYFLVLSFWIF